VVSGITAFPTPGKTGEKVAKIHAATDRLLMYLENGAAA